MQASKKHSFLRRSPLAYVVVPLAFVLVSTALVLIVGHTVLAPYQALLGWFFSTTEVAQPRDLLDNAAAVINGGTVDEPDAQPDRLPLSSVTYPSEGDRYATITISGTNVDAPVYYGDTNKILNAGVGTYKETPASAFPARARPSCWPGTTTPSSMTCSTPRPARRSRSRPTTVSTPTRSPAPRSSTIRTRPPTTSPAPTRI